MLLLTLMALCTTREVSRGLRKKENQFYLLFSSLACVLKMLVSTGK